jgi:lysozyme
MTAKQTSPKGIAFLEHEEGKILRWYKDFAGLWTCCTGHRRVDGDLARYPQNHVFTQDEDDAILAGDLRVTEACVNSFVANIGQNMFDALVSLGFNIGTGAERVSSVAKMMREGGYMAAADHFLEWDKAVIGGKLTVSAVLLARRQRERAIFLLDVSSLDEQPDSDRIVTPGDIG